ncbi:MAG: FKBP-type peptidyl-prolyl cis-trans isomerase [Saprospiraceae bacterium]
MKKVFYLAIVLFAVSVSSCKDEFSLEEQVKEIRQRLSEEGILDETIETPEGVFVHIYQESNTNEYPTSTSTVEVRYEGTFFDNGVIFDSSQNSLRTFSLNSVIRGWKIGIPQMEKSSRGTIYVPSDLAYGDFTRNGIPGGSILIFDVELYDFQ